MKRPDRDLVGCTRRRGTMRVSRGGIPPDQGRSTACCAAPGHRRRGRCTLLPGGTRFCKSPQKSSIALTLCPGFDARCRPWFSPSIHPAGRLPSHKPRRVNRLTTQRVPMEPWRPSCSVSLVDWNIRCEWGYVRLRREAQDFVKRIRQRRSNCRITYGTRGSHR